MDIKYLTKLKNIYYSEIFSCLDFWLEKGIDNKYKGYITRLDREGRIFGTEKSVWFQGRGLYIFSKAYNDIEKNAKWLEAAKKGYEFLKKYCYDSDKRMFFIVTQDGRPIQKRRYYFSETFAAIGCAEYYKATGNAEALELARDTFDTIVYLYENPQSLPQKYNSDVIKEKGLNVPLILIATTQVLREADSDNVQKYDAFIGRIIDEILRHYLKPDKKALLETVGREGEFFNTPAGRTVNPGHSILTSWLIMNEGNIKSDKNLIDKSLDILNWTYDLSWDKKYGGILYFVDILGMPCDRLEWDMKLWWPHSEALVAYMMAYKTTNDKKYLVKFRQLHDYTFKHFRDKEYGEWYGYLHRDGTVSNYLKGNIFKGPFHIPRALMLCYLMLNEMHLE